MKYNQPLDQPSSPDAPYVDANSSLGTPGSIVPAAAVEYPQREIVRTIQDVGLSTPTNDDLSQLSQAIRFMREQNVIDVGTVNAISVALNPTPTDWLQPLSFFVKIGHTNTSTVVTLGIVGVTGTKTVLKRDGSALAVGDLVAGSILLFVFDGTNMRCATLLNSDLPVFTSPGTPTWTFNIQVFPASGTYTKTTGATKAIAIATGGGGAGGSAKTGGSVPAVGGGGESGGTAIQLINLSGVTSIPITIGAGATPTAGSSATSGTQASPGGDTTVGSGGSIYAVAKGGKSGFNSMINGTPAGGTGGGTGLILIPGKPGEGAMATIDNLSSPGPWSGVSAGPGLRGGTGGSSIWGGAGRGADSNVTGTVGGTAIVGYDATGYGSGGGGADCNGTANVAGGAGKDGLVMIIEFGLT